LPVDSRRQSPFYNKVFPPDTLKQSSQVRPCGLGRFAFYVNGEVRAVVAAKRAFPPVRLFRTFGFRWSKFHCVLEDSLRHSRPSRKWDGAVFGNRRPLGRDKR